MIKGTFASIRLRNKITPEKEGGFTKLFPEDKLVSIYEASQEYKKQTPLVVLQEKSMEPVLPEIGLQKELSF